MIKKIWKDYSRYLKVSQKESNLALSFGIIGAFLETFSIYLLANIITNLGYKNSVIVIEGFNKFGLRKEICILIFFIAALLSAISYFISNKNIIIAKCQIERFVREEITDLTLNIKWEYYLKISQGDISKAIISEGQNISEGYLYFISAITYTFIAVTYLIACLVLVPNTFLILLVYGIFAYRIYIYYSEKADYFGKNLSSITSNIGSWTSAIFNNLKYLRSISRDQIAKKESKEIFLKFTNSYEKARVASYKSKFITELLTIIFICLLIIFIILSGSNTSNLILSLSLFIRMTPKIYNAQSRLLDSVAMSSWPKKHLEKIEIAKKFEEDNLVNNRKFKFDGNIIFDSVSFNYPKSATILKNINLSIKQNELIAITGKSGIGKSTLLDLLTGIIKPNKGNIYLSDINIESININSWREKIGMVMQQNFFKNDTISSNISLGRKINKKKIKECLLKSNAWDFVNKLPNGIEEPIFDRGIRFSGGERQKLALARALYTDPEILLLDEPTTGLDLYSEKELLSSINQIKGSMIIIIISHKKEVLKICEKVYELSNGGLKKI